MKNKHTHNYTYSRPHCPKSKSKSKKCAMQLNSNSPIPAASLARATTRSGAKRAGRRPEGARPHTLSNHLGHNGRVRSANFNFTAVDVTRYLQPHLANTAHRHVICHPHCTTNAYTNTVKQSDPANWLAGFASTSSTLLHIPHTLGHIGANTHATINLEPQSEEQQKRRRFHDKEEQTERSTGSADRTVRYYC